MVYWVTAFRLKTDHRHDMLHIDTWTGRQFRARRIGNRFFLEEIVMVGVWSAFQERWLVSPGRLWFSGSPNQTVRTILRHLARQFRDSILKDCELVAVGSGFLPGGTVFDSLDRCSEQVARVIHDNVRYLPENVDPLLGTHLHERNLTWVHRAMALRQKIQRVRDTRRKLWCFDRSRIHPRIRHYLANPSRSLWNKIALLPITDMLPISAWESWRRIDPSAPRARPRWFHQWEKIPSAAMLETAIDIAVDRTVETLGLHIQSLTEQYDRICDLYSVRATSPKVLAPSASPAALSSVVR